MSGVFFISSAIGEVTQVRDGIYHFAEVELEIQPLGEGIGFNLTGNGWQGQGYIEVANDSYQHWKAGAEAGIKFAFEVMGLERVGVVVTRISGRDFIDTNPWTVGEAAAKAIWTAADFTPPPDLLEQLEALVATSWKFPDDQIPDFTPLKEPAP